MPFYVRPTVHWRLWRLDSEGRAILSRRSLWRNREGFRWGLFCLEFTSLEELTVTIYIRVEGNEKMHAMWKHLTITIEQLEWNTDFFFRFLYLIWTSYYNIIKNNFQNRDLKYPIMVPTVKLQQCSRPMTCIYFSFLSSFLTKHTHYVHIGTHAYAIKISHKPTHRNCEFF